MDAPAAGQRENGDRGPLGAHDATLVTELHLAVDEPSTYAYTREDLPPSIGMFAAGRVDVRPLIAGEVAPEEVPELIARLRREGTGGRRHLIKF